MSIKKNIISNLTKLSCIKIYNEKFKDTIILELNDIMNIINKIKKINTNDQIPSYHMITNNNLFKKNKKISNNLINIIDNQKIKNNFFIAPKIINK